MVSRPSCREPIPCADPRTCPWFNRLRSQRVSTAAFNCPFDRLIPRLVPGMRRTRALAILDQGLERILRGQNQRPIVGRVGAMSGRSIAVGTVVALTGMDRSPGRRDDGPDELLPFHGFDRPDDHSRGGRDERRSPPVPSGPWASLPRTPRAGRSSRAGGGAAGRGPDSLASSSRPRPSRDDRGVLDGCTARIIRVSAGTSERSNSPLAELVSGGRGPVLGRRLRLDRRRADRPAQAGRKQAQRREEAHGQEPRRGRMQDVTNTLRIAKHLDPP